MLRDEKRATRGGRGAPCCVLPRTWRVFGDDDSFAVHLDVTPGAEVLEDAADHLSRAADAAGHVLLRQALAYDHLSIVFARQFDQQMGDTPVNVQQSEISDGLGKLAHAV